MIFKKISKLFYLIIHCIQFKKIAGPGFLNYAGGIFNPGALFIDGKYVLLAKSQIQHWIHIRDSKSNTYLKGAPTLLNLDKTFKVETAKILKEQNYSNNKRWGMEDFRMFSHENVLYVNHALMFVDEDATVPKYKEAMQALSVLDIEKETLTFKGFPKTDFSINKIEKNWIYWSNGNEVVMFYSFFPYHVLKLTDKENLLFTTIIKQQLAEYLKDIGNFGTQVSFSTNPISYDDEHLLLLIHQYKLEGYDRFYHHWGVLVNKKDLQISKITSKPIIAGKKVRGQMPGVIYTTSVVKQKDSFVFFNGEADAYITSRTIKNSDLSKLWITVDSRKKVAG